MMEFEDEEEYNIQNLVNHFEPMDTAIVVISALSPFGNTEADMVVALLEQKRLKDLIFVITFMDKIEEDEQEKFCTYMKRIIRKKVSAILKKIYKNEEHPYRKKFKKVMEEISVVGLSSTMALEGLAIDDFTLLQKSGAILLAGELRKRFGEYQVACILERSSEIMCDLVSRLPKIYEDEVIYLQKRKENVSTVETGELIQALEREKDGIKELFKKKFMSELTNINPLEIEKVQQGMMRSTIQLYEYMNQEYHKAVENQLLNVFYQQIEFYLLPLKDRMKDPFLLVIVGEFNTGKSTFINTLLGREVVPTNFLEETITINRISYGETSKKEAVLKDGRRIRLEDDELERDKMEELQESLDSEILYVDVKENHPLLEDICIVDTPGLSGMEEELPKQLEIKREAIKKYIEKFNVETKDWMIGFFNRLRSELNTMVCDTDTVILQKYASFFVVDVIQQAIHSCVEVHQRELVDKLSKELSTETLLHLDDAIQVQDVSWTVVDSATYIADLVAQQLEMNLTLVLGFGRLIGGFIRQAIIGKKQDEYLNPIMENFFQVQEEIFSQIDTIYQHMGDDIYENLEKSCRMQLNENLESINETKVLIQLNKESNLQIEMQSELVKYTLTNMEMRLKKFR